MQKRFYLTPAAVIIFILYFTVFGDRGLLRINHLHRDRDEMQKNLQELKTENDRLRREISALQSDRRYLESIARRDFGLVRGNEVIYQFPNQPGAAGQGGQAQGNPAPGTQAQGAQAQGAQAQGAHGEKMPAKPEHRGEPGKTAGAAASAASDKSALPTEKKAGEQKHR